MSRPIATRGLGPDTRRDEAARRLLASRLADVRAYEEVLGAHPAEDPVHDMRVATRRLRAALQVFDRQGTLAPLEREVKRLQDALGEVRDLHVQDAWLAQAARGRRGSVRAGLAVLRAHQSRRVAEGEAQLQKALTRWQRRTVPRLREAAQVLRDGGRYGGPRSRRHLGKSLRRVARRLRAHEGSADALSAHRLRIAVKRLRYEAEVLRPGLRRKMTALLEALVPLQEGLGDLHDVDVRLEWLGQLAARGTPAQREAARALLAEAQEQRRRCAGETAREVQRWRTERLARALRRLLD